jgi:hypothetical protein
MYSFSVDHDDVMKQDDQSGKISNTAKTQRRTTTDGADTAATKTSAKGSKSSSPVSETFKKTFMSHSKEKSVRTGDDVVKSLKYVIFPNNK